MADKSKNRPTVEGPAGFTPGNTPGNTPENLNASQARGTYSRTNQPPPANNGRAAFGIDPQGQILLEREEAEALQRETRKAANDAGRAANAAGNYANRARNDATYTERRANEILDALNSMEEKMDRAVAVSTRARNASVTSAAESALKLEESKEATERAIVQVQKTEAMVEEFKQATMNYVAGVGAAQRAELNAKLQEIDAKMKELDEKTKELAERKQIDPELVEELKRENESIKNVVNNKNTNENPNENTPLERSKMGICFIKFEANTNILNPFAGDRENSNKINPILPVNFDVDLEGIGDFYDVPAGNYLFVDNFELKLSDFKNMNRSDFIQLILNPKKYIDFLQKLEESSVERQFVDFRKKDKLSKTDRKINKENAKIYAAKLFAARENFNIVYPRRPDGRGGFYFDYVIMSHEIEKKDIQGPDAFRFDVKKKEVTLPQAGGSANSSETYTFFTFKIKLVLDSRERSEISSKDVKAVGCEQRKAKIYKIMGSLNGTKKIMTAILGPEGAKKYLVDDTKLEDLHGRAKPLPSKKDRYAVEKSMLDKLSFVSQVNRSDLPVNRKSENQALQRERIANRSLTGGPSTIDGGRKKTKRIIYKKKNYKTKKYINTKNNKKTYKIKKMKKMKKTRKI